jgi:hypothetical protein
LRDLCVCQPLASPTLNALLTHLTQHSSRQAKLGHATPIAADRHSPVAIIRSRLVASSGCAARGLRRARAYPVVVTSCPLASGLEWDALLGATDGPGPDQSWDAHDGPGPANHCPRESLLPVRWCFPAANLPPAAQSLDHERAVVAGCSAKAPGACQTRSDSSHLSGRVHGTAAGSIDFARDTSAVHRRPTVISSKPGRWADTLLSNDVALMLTHCGSSCSFPRSACPRR